MLFIYLFVIVLPAGLFERERESIVNKLHWCYYCDINFFEAESKQRVTFSIYGSFRWKVTGKNALVLGKRQGVNRRNQASKLVGEIMPVPLLCNTMRFDRRSNVLLRGLKIVIFDRFLGEK